MAAAQRLEHGLGAGERLQAAAVAAAADRPARRRSSRGRSRRRCRRAVVEAAVEDEAGADAGGDLDVDEVRAAAARRPTRSRPARRGWRRSRRARAGRARALMSASGRAPIQPGRIAESPTSPRVAAQRARQAHADAGDTRSAATPTSSSSRRTSAPGQRDALVGLVVDVERLLGLGEDRVREVGDRRRARASGRSRCRRRRRPSGSAPARGRAPGSSASSPSSQPASRSSRAMLEIVAGERPLARARSACDIGPRARSSARIRCAVGGAQLARRAGVGVAHRERRSAGASPCHGTFGT